MFTGLLGQQTNEDLKTQHPERRPPSGCEPLLQTEPCQQPPPIFISLDPPPPPPQLPSSPEGNKDQHGDKSNTKCQFQLRS